MRSIVATLPALVLLVAACGGGDDSGGTTDDGTLLRIVGADEFEFQADDPMRLPAGSEVVVELRNRGSIEHSWALLAAGVTASSSEDIGAGDVLAEVHAKPAASEPIRFVVPAPGTYRAVCTIPGHLEAGMEMTLVAEG